MKIFPYEVEEVLRSFPSIKDVSIYGVHDAIYGEKPQADVVFDSDSKTMKSYLLN